MREIDSSLVRWQQEEEIEKGKGRREKNQFQVFLVYTAVKTVVWSDTTRAPTPFSSATLRPATTEPSGRVIHNIKKTENMQELGGGKKKEIEMSPNYGAVSQNKLLQPHLLPLLSSLRRKTRI